ncbi:MAG: hypothetical protein AAGN66_26440 [Acidobacteriota bacterium]
MTLESTLSKLREGSAERIPAAARDVMHRATEDLRASGLADRAISAGDRFPAFALGNTAGETVASEDLLARGPLVATVYRGVW